MDKVNMNLIIIYLITEELLILQNRSWKLVMWNSISFMNYNKICGLRALVPLATNQLSFWVDSQKIFLNWAVWNWKDFKSFSTLLEYYNCKQPSFFILSFIRAYVWKISKLNFSVGNNVKYLSAYLKLILTSYLEIGYSRNSHFANIFTIFKTGEEV